MLRRLAVLACLAAAPALAPAQTIIITESNDTDRAISIKECNSTAQDTISFQWTVSTTTTTTLYDLFVSNTSGCPTPSSTSNIGAVTEPIQPGITGTATSGSFAGGQTAGQLLSLAGVATCNSSTSAIFFCVFTPGTQGSATPALATGSITVDLLTPPAPTITSVTPGDSALNVSWTNGAGAADAGVAGAATNYNIFAVPGDGTAPEKLFRNVTGGQTTGRIEGLINDKEYSVTVSALTAGGNESPRSTAATGTPVVILDFWRLYRQDGGREQGGCATGAAGLTALLALTPLLWRRRRRGVRS